MGKPLGKNPFFSSQSPLGSSLAEIVTISLHYILRACSGRVLGTDAAVGHVHVALPLELFSSEIVLGLVLLTESPRRTGPE